MREDRAGGGEEEEIVRFECQQGRSYRYDPGLCPQADYSFPPRRCPKDDRRSQVLQVPPGQETSGTQVPQHDFPAREGSGLEVRFRPGAHHHGGLHGQQRPPPQAQVIKTYLHERSPSF